MKPQEIKEVAKEKPVLTKSILDVSSDEDDLFKAKTKLTTKKDKSLFGDDDNDDDLFGANTVKGTFSDSIKLDDILCAWLPLQQSLFMTMASFTASIVLPVLCRLAYSMQEGIKLKLLKAVPKAVKTLNCKMFFFFQKLSKIMHLHPNPSKQLNQQKQSSSILFLYLEKTNEKYQKPQSQYNF